MRFEAGTKPPQVITGYWDVVVEGGFLAVGRGEQKPPQSSSGPQGEPGRATQVLSGAQDGSARLPHSIVAVAVVVVVVVGLMRRHWEKLAFGASREYKGAYVAMAGALLVLLWRCEAQWQ